MKKHKDKLTRNTKEKQIKCLLMDEKNTISIDKALSNAKKRWRK